MHCIVTTAQFTSLLYQEMQRNQFSPIDDKNRVYIIFTVEEVQNTMRCAKQKATKLMQELEAIGLIEKIRQGLGKPNLLYVKNFVRKGRKAYFQKNENHTSGSMESENPEVPESYGSFSLSAVNSSCFI